MIGRADIIVVLLGHELAVGRRDGDAVRQLTGGQVILQAGGLYDSLKILLRQKFRFAEAGAVGCLSGHALFVVQRHGGSGRKALDRGQHAHEHQRTHDAHDEQPPHPQQKDFAQEPDRKSIEETLERCKHRLPSLTAGSTLAAGGLLLRRSGLFCAFVPFRHRCSGGIQSCRGVVLLRRLGRSCLGPTGWMKDIELPLHRLRRGRRRQDRLHRRDGGRRRSGRGIGMLFFCHLGLRSRGRCLRDGVLLLCPAKERALLRVLCGMARGRRATPGCLFRAGLADPLIQFFPR